MEKLFCRSTYRYVCVVLYMIQTLNLAFFISAAASGLLCLDSLWGAAAWLRVVSPQTGWQKLQCDMAAAVFTVRGVFHFYKHLQ